jgi:hypothetical protein
MAGSSTLLNRGIKYGLVIAYNGAHILYDTNTILIKILKVIERSRISERRGGIRGIATFFENC